MDVIRGAEEFSAATAAARKSGRAVGLVPTMGALHEGHDGLIRRARDRGGFVAVSIFVNPKQFEDQDDLERYPRDEGADFERCERLGADAVFAPPVQEMFPPDLDLPSPAPGRAGDTFEGSSRPGHFAGVLSVVHHLLSLTGPTSAFFGEKDAQQLFLVRSMVSAAGLPAEIVACPTAREPDGLAFSSRNRNLTPEEREQAPSLFLGLSEAAVLARRGERDPAVLVATLARELGAASLARLDYAAIVEDSTFEPIDVCDRPARAIVAARFSQVRLIDNLLMPGPAS